jgi:hypothetical protein
MTQWGFPPVDFLAIFWRRQIRVNSSSLKDGASISRAVSQLLSDSALFTGART